MTAEEVVYHVLDALEAENVPYMVVGSFSSNFYGIPRSTKDADIVVEVNDVPVGRIASRLGPGFRLDSQMSFETVTGTFRFTATHEAHDRARFARRRKGAMPGRTAFVASPEDVIITKLRWARGGKRAKDVEDVRNVIALQYASIDWAYVREWCRQHGTGDLLEQLAQEAERDRPPR
jgi:hypothetical protein